jgi:hypothetical protein
MEMFWCLHVHMVLCMQYYFGFCKVIDGNDICFRLSTSRFCVCCNGADYGRICYLTVNRIVNLISNCWCGHFTT